MRKALVALVLLAGCSGNGGDGEGNQITAEAPAKSGEVSAPAGGLTTLTGLYEGGAAATPDQMCIVEGEGQPRFGLVVWGANLHSCSGSGTVARVGGDTLRFSMAGDEACAIDARISGDTITLPAVVPAGCAYYCGARARLAGATFARKGRSAADAGKAKDLVGDPLCTER